jgi:lysyl-tRNA synthetase class I
MLIMPTIIQVNNKSFKYHDLPLVSFLEEPSENMYFVRNPEQSSSKRSPKMIQIEKKAVDFAIKMKILPNCKQCGRILQVTKVEPYIHENYRITFQCQHHQCGKDVQNIYYQNIL